MRFLLSMFTKAYCGGTEMVELGFFEEIEIELSCKDGISLVS